MFNWRHRFLTLPEAFMSRHETGVVEAGRDRLSAFLQGVRERRFSLSSPPRKKIRTVRSHRRGIIGRHRSGGVLFVFPPARPLQDLRSRGRREGSREIFGRFLTKTERASHSSPLTSLSQSSRIVAKKKRKSKKIPHPVGSPPKSESAWFCSLYRGDPQAGAHS